MGQRKRLILSTLLAVYLHISHGCQMENVVIWAIPVQQRIFDTFNGTVLSRQTTNIEAITSVTYGEAITRGPYFDITLEDSQFVMNTNEAYRSYEEYEEAQRVSLTVDFRCAGGGSESLIFWIDITDTNNNAPRFIPYNEFEFTVAPPLPPGFFVTGCLNNIVVRDIDLTTQRIDFVIEDNPYFEIEYDATSSSVAKEFNAQLRTTTFIRTISEPITLTITATDVDLTNDPPLSTTTTVRIIGDTEFQFPEEPIFNQTFYFANYTDDHQLNLLETISLRQGFDEYVNFALDGEYATFFTLSTNGNQVLIRVETPLPDYIWAERQIILIVRAEREYTSGDSTTVIVKLPEEDALQFESVYYEGTIVNNSLQLSPLILSQGYDGATSVEVVGEYSNSFTASLTGNLVTLTMGEQIGDIIEDNSFITLEVVASNNRSSDTTVVNLDIIKDDNVTPVFDKPIYEGAYVADTGLAVDQIIIVQGFDDTVAVGLTGEYANYFQVNQNGNTITLTSSPLPAELYSLRNILIVIEATKPRTVGANAAINIVLPAATNNCAPARNQIKALDVGGKDVGTTYFKVFTDSFRFGQDYYKGYIENDMITLDEIALGDYTSGVNYSLSGEYADYFQLRNDNGIFTLQMETLPTDVFENENVFLFKFEAQNTNRRTHTIVVLENISRNDDDTEILEFEEPYYVGTYSSLALLQFDSQIRLTTEMDQTVTIVLEGAHSEWFGLTRTDNSVTVTLTSPIPAAVLANNQQLVFVVTAQRPGSATARATVVISLVDEITEGSNILGFDRVTYLGSMDNNQTNIPALTLSEGFTQDVVFTLHGDLSNYFSVSSVGAVVTVSLQSPIPEQALPANGIIVLEIQASAPPAVTAYATIVIGIVSGIDEAPAVELIFAQTFYSGSYSAGAGLSFPTPITLTQGYNSDVQFALEGDNAQWFGLTRTDNSVTVTLTSPIPAAVLANNQQLVFVVTAQRQGSATARATVVISLVDEITEGSNILGFDRVTYLGSMDNNQTNIPILILSEGFTQDVVFTLHGDLSNYFSVSSVGAVVTVSLQSPIPEQALPANGIIVLEIQASAPPAVTAYATIVIGIVSGIDEAPAVELIFAQTFYSGSYSAGAGLSFPTPITLTQGYNSDVQFALEGDNAQWFGLTRTDNSVTVTLTSPIPAAVLANNQQLVFVVTAQRQGSATARATVVISLVDEITEGSNILGFDRVTYLGSMDNNQTNIPTITLSEGFTQDVVFTLYGDLSNYFSVSSVGAVVTVSLQSPIPEQALPANGIIVLEIQASAPPAVTAYATIVIGIVSGIDEAPAVELIFAQTFYSGSYSAGAGLSFPTPITLTQGYNSDVQFALEGDNAQWFGLTRTDNSVTVTLTSPIPAAVLANNQQLVFVVTAQRQGSATARATVVISLVDEITEGSNILGFDRVTYLGSMDNNQTNIPTLTLSEGFTQDVVFTLHGDLSNYFSVSSVGAVVTVSLQSPIPEQALPANGIIVLEIQASAPPAVTAYATIVIGIVSDIDDAPAVELIFAQTFYSGSYSAGAGLSFPTPITLTQGYNSDVQFALEGDNAQWFGLTRTDNSVTVTLTSPIPAAVLANNQQLVFVVTAQRQGSATARATVVISLVDEITEGSNILGFDRVTYLGSMDNNQTNIPTLTLSEGFTQDVVFTLHGDLSNYFSVSSVGAVVTVSLQSPIPEQALPANGIIVLEIQASAPPAVTAYATIVIGIVSGIDDAPAVELIFAQTFYSGSYSAGAGLSFPTPITLTQGYNSDVQFALEGDNAQWFGLTRTDNSVTVTLTSPIPAAVLANNQQLVFVVTAQRQGSATARATVVISLVDEITEGSNILGFDRVTYLGSMDNNQTNIPTLTLSEGFTQDVVFTLHGDLSNYFSVSSVGAVVTVSLQSPIPEQALPANGIIVLEIQASAPPAVTAYATIVIGIVSGIDDAPAVELIFAQTFYSGSYSAGAGLSFPTPITLTQGYNSDVQFALEGDNAQWFGLTRTDNSVTVTLTSPIPAAVLANNQQLVFVVTAQRQGSATARATVVISLVDEITEGSNILGFDRVTYLGSMDNNQTNIPTITLSEGFTQDVVFTLHGDLSNYFSVSSVGAVVTVSLQSPIPEQALPANGIIVLEIQASAPPAVTAYATIVIGIVSGIDEAPAVELIFAQTFYSGSYSAGAGLSFPTPITLTQGYNSDVQFALEGDNAQWFGLTRTDNSVTVTLTSPIPAAVLANNQQLVFVVTAQRQGSATARATVVISLVDEITEGSNILGFDRVTYLGSMDNNQTNIPTITLSEGFTQDVVFTLYGDLINYFSVSSVGAVVTVSLQSPISEQALPANGIIVLEIQASAPPAVTAYATIVIYHATDDSQPGSDVFEKVLFEGIIQNGAVSHERIAVTGFSGSNVELIGEYSTLFVATLSNSVVIITAADTFTLPDGTHHVALEIRAGPASAVLLLNVIQTDAPSLPTVSFSSTSYTVRVDVTQTGVVGRVQATADNGEAVIYSLQLDNVHLEERLSVNAEGELRLSAPVNSGAYAFIVVATTVFTQIQGIATVHLSVDAITVCGDELVMPPLIVLDVDEEESHYDLIHGTRYDNCHFTMSNRWPLDQNWLFVNESGLHTTAIDREHESIAFMALSQVQVEIILICDSDVTRTKRSVTSNSLGPYDYGTNKWVLTDTILYNSRRSLVNVIVNDINDNAPIFVGKDNEPVAVGYPVPELAERVLPRSLAELQATDADIGENAELLYWSSAVELAVAPTTGFVHLRNGATLENGVTLTVHATDRNGEGLTGSLDILVRLLDENYIAVLTVRDSFLDDEQSVLSQLTEAVGYEVKVLRSIVVSSGVDTDEVSRKKRDAPSAAGSSLRLYIYGLVAREPVSVERLTTDINNIAIASVIIESAISLQDHLEAQEICVIGRDTGLLVATIVLSVLLFIVLVAIAVWFFLRWRKNRNYDQFSDENSLASKIESADKFPRPEALPKPRLDIGELKKSERRLQEMLDAPIEEVSVEPTMSRADAILDMPVPEPNLPIVIQSIDKLKDAADDSTDDEFGEVKAPQRKSVVTFNENVEKIIHVEDLPDDIPEDLSEDPDFEIYKL